MKLVFIKNLHKPLFISLMLTILLSSCHSNYICIDAKLDGSMAWDKNSSAFAFIARNRLYRRPVGIAKFPDGGMVKNEYLDFSLYYFDINKNKLTHLISLNEFYRGADYRWLSFSHINLELDDSLLFYKLEAPYSFNHIKDKVYLFTAKKDSIKNMLFFEDIAKTYKFNILIHERSVVDTSKHKRLFCKKRNKLYWSLAKKYLIDIPYSDWGIVLKDLYPQSKKDYMDYIIEKEGNTSTLKAIYEQIVPSFDANDKEYILRKMEQIKQEIYEDYKKINEEKDPYQKSLKKSAYENYVEYMKETNEKLNKTN